MGFPKLKAELNVCVYVICPLEARESKAGGFKHMFTITATAFKGEVRRKEGGDSLRHHRQQLLEAREEGEKRKVLALLTHAVVAVVVAMHPPSISKFR